MSFFNQEEMKSRWQQQVRGARIAWTKLTEDELLESEGRQDRLIGLLQERYAVSCEEASRRVRNFMEVR